MLLIIQLFTSILYSSGTLAKIMAAGDNEFLGYDVLQSTPYSCYALGLPVSLINFVSLGKNKQRNLGCLFPSHLLFRLFYFSIFTVSKQRQSTQSFLSEELFMPESILPLLRALSSPAISPLVWASKQRRVSQMCSTTRAALQHLCSCQLHRLYWSCRATRRCGNRATVNCSTKHQTPAQQKCCG